MTSEPPAVTVVIPVRDEEASVRQLLEALSEQTLVPNEILFVDSGSRDGTRAIIEEAALPSCRVVSIPRSSRIGAARNVGVRLASSSVVATTDGGAHPDPHWLESLTRPIFTGASSFSYGAVVPWGSTQGEAFLSELLLPPAGMHREGAGINTAYTVDAWREAGGYPESPVSGEDLGLVERMTKAEITAAYVPTAVVYWHGPGSISSYLRQYFRYAEGDAVRRRNLQAHVLRLATYTCATLSVRHRVAVLPTLIQVCVRTGDRIARLRAHAATRSIPYGHRFELSVPLLLVMGDMAKIAGFVKGLLSTPK